LKKLAWAALVLVLLGAGLWLYGRAPTPYQIERACVQYQMERRERFRQLSDELGKALGTAREADARAALDGYLRDHRSLSMRGWAVLLIPAGAKRPDPQDFLKAGTVEPAAKKDPGELRGGMQVWIAPRGPIARMLVGMGVAP